MNQSAKCDISRLKSESLWQLRLQIDINSTCVNDCKNDFGIDEHDTLEFFRCYANYLEMCAEESGLWDEVVCGIHDEIKDGLLVGCNLLPYKMLKLNSIEF